MIIKVTEQNFKEFENSKDLVMLDFFATWCGHCENFAPIIEDVDKNLDGKIKIGKIDVDEQEDIAEKFQVTSIPTLIFMKNGELVNKHVGAMNSESLKNLINKLNN